MGRGTTGSDDVDREQVIERLAVAVGRINRKLRPSNPELSYGQLSALSSIVRLGPLRPGDLARIESITAPSATRLIGGLELSGFVTRTPDPADGRAFFIEASDAGAQAVLRARAERADILKALLAGRSDNEITSMAPALELLESASQAEPAPAN
jgi:DNA-binding MarR family transcriptional regulator